MLVEKDGSPFPSFFGRKGNFTYWYVVVVLVVMRTWWIQENDATQFKKVTRRVKKQKGTQISLTRNKVQTPEK